jgi:hypothetical protein
VRKDPNVAEERLFTIKFDGDLGRFATFYTGHTVDGRQLLVGWSGSREQPFLFLWFDADGRFLSAELFGSPCQDMGPEEDYLAYCKRYDDFHLRRLAERGAEFGYRPGPIRVRHFYIDEPFLVAIRLTWSWAIELLCEPYSAPIPFDQVARDLQRVKDRVASGLFGLHWGDEGYGFDQEGRRGDWPATATYVEPDRVYPLWTHGTEGGEAAYYAGRLPDGSQALMGPYDDGRSVLLARFDADGALAEERTRPVPGGRETAWREALAWQRELGWRPGPIRVRKFMLPEHHAYLAEGPREVIIGKFDPYYYPDPEVRQRLLADVAAWEAQGNFVLWWWTNDYYLGPDGRPLPA